MDVRVAKIKSRKLNPAAKLFKDVIWPNDTFIIRPGGYSRAATSTTCVHYKFYKYKLSATPDDSILI